jgi:hypothetical protein
VIKVAWCILKVHIGPGYDLNHARILISPNHMHGSDVSIFYIIVRGMIFFFLF